MFLLNVNINSPDSLNKHGVFSFFQVSQEQSDENDSEKSNEEIELDKHALKSVDIKPYTTADGREIGLVVHHVIEGSYVDRTGELQTADRITEINGIQLDSLSNAAVQDIFEEALISDIIKIKRTRSHMFLKDQIKLDQIPQQEVPKEVLQMSKEAPRVLPVMPNSEPNEAAIEGNTCFVVWREGRSRYLGYEGCFSSDLTVYLCLSLTNDVWFYVLNVKIISYFKMFCYFKFSTIHRVKK